MTLKEYNEKYHDIDPFALGKSIYTLKPIPDYDTVPYERCDRKKRNLTDEQRKKIGERLRNSRNRK